VITFQRSVSFSGDTHDLPSVQVTFEVPRLAFSASDDVVTRLYATPAASATFEQPTDLTTYRVIVPGAPLADDSRETQALAARYYTTAFQSGDLDAFVLPVTAAYRSPDGQLLGTSGFSVLAIPTFASQTNTRASSRTAVHPPTMDSVVVLDRADLLALRSKVRGVDDSVLLLALMGCTTIADGTPSFNEAGPTEVARWLESQDMDPVVSANLIAAITSAHSRLVDIELEIPTPQPLKIAGTLTVSAPADVTIAAADFAAFEVIADWVDASSGHPQVRSIRFTDEVTVTDDSADFTLTDADPVYRSGIRSDVVMTVRGMGVPLWTRRYRADDPDLATLAITVARQAPGTLTTPDTPPVDPNLRLRGRVVVLHPNCATRNLLVWVEANATGNDADWHVVGATTADDAGNFSVPYPYGTYVAGRVRCSAAPRTPANIAIVPAAGDRTLSDDFLYLLVEDAPARDKPCVDEDCDCGDRKTSGRLPDFEDLIGSDVYSQDLGTGCINLSTPNRTINEHNFQAIVRTSDPDVATYQLSRHELGLDEIDIAQVAALVTGAAVLRERASAATGIASTQDPADDNHQLLNAITSAHPHALAVAAALPSSGFASQAIDAAAVASATADLVAIITTLEAVRDQLAAKGGSLSTAGDRMLAAARDLKALLDRGPYLFELDYAQHVANAARTLVTQAAAALDSARLNAQAPPLISQALNTAVQNIAPHVQAVATTLAKGGPPITLSALAKVYTHLDAVTSILQVAFAQLVRAGAGVPATAVAVVDAAQTLKPLVDHAIDTAGTSVRYELTPATSTRTRQPVGLTNPIEWRRAPEAVAADTRPALNRPAAFAVGNSTRDVAEVSWPPAPAPTTEPGDAEAEFAQAVSVATGHILHYKVLFKADGYSLGDVVYSLPLAPGQKKEIVVFDSSQRLLGAESQQLTQNERLAMGLVDERDITSQLAGNLSESIRGSSSANTSGVSAGFGTGGQGYGGGQAYGGSGSAVLGVAGGVAQAGSTAQQDSSRDVSQFFGEKLRQAIMQNAEGYRALNASVVTTVQQGQRYAVTSETIANHNHCHSLTIMYFEVLRHYAIFQELASVEECLFVPLLLARFSVDNIAAWRDVLAPALLPMPSETYLQPFVAMAGSVREHPLIKGFDAMQRLRTSYANVDMPAGSYDEEPIRFMKGSLQLRVNLSRPKTRYDRIKSLPVVNRLETPNPSSVVRSTTTTAILAGLTGGLSLLFTGPNVPEPQVVQAKEAIFDAFMSMDANYENVPPASCIRVNNFRPVPLTFNGHTYPAQPLDFFEDGKRDREQWEQYSRLLGYTDVIDMLEYYFRGRLIAEWDDIFYNDIVPLAFDTLVDNLRLSEFATDVTALRRYNGGEQLIAVNISGTTTKSRSQLPQQLTLTVAGASAQALRSYVTFDVEDVALNYSTAHYNGPLYSGSLGDDLLDPVNLDIPERADEQRNPRREDRYLAAALIEHLNNNLEHYNRVLWTRLDPDRRYMLLDGFAIQVYDDDGHPVPAKDGGVRSLASVVKNEVITVAGNSLVLPVAPGYRVSGDLIRATGPDGKKRQATLFDHYKPLTAVTPYRVSVPTPGVFAEAVQGQCNACEKIETDRLQDWSRFPIDEPTPIAPVSLPTPTPQDWQAAWRDFAQPMVNIQNAPGLPAPGAGLAGLSDALTKSGVFKDITGLDANQLNAMKTYLSNQENAKAFAEMAKEMAMQSHNTTNSGKIMDTISGAQRSGAITPTEANQLVKDHLQQQIDGGAGKNAQAESANKSAVTPYSQIASTGASQGRDVTVSRQDSTGNREDVSISGPQTSRVLAEVFGTVPKLKQSEIKENDCWAVAAAIMIGWNSRQPDISPADAAAAAGSAYLEMYDQDTGLFAKDQDDFLLHREMMGEPPNSYTLQQYVEWMQTYGPLWVTIDAGPGDAFSPHAWILTRIAGTGTADGADTYVTYIEPADGTEVTKTFAEFVRAYEQLAYEDHASIPRPQVIHFIARVNVPIGYHIQGPFNIHEPIHERITLAALTASTVPVPAGTTVGSNLDINEFFRGVIWQDDPELLLFNDLTRTNWDFTTGKAWKKQYDAAKGATTNDRTNLTGRSHFFDLQFLHAMASAKGEPAQDTLAKIMLWAEVMYRLSIGEGITGTTLLSEVAVTTTTTAPDGTVNTYRLSRYFDTSSRPTGDAMLDGLLTRRTRFAGADLSRRAIGSLLHLVQDSYAKGHVQRTLLNPTDLQSGSTDQFKPGTWGRYGEILSFHCYKNQNETLHSKYDTASGVDASKVDTFNQLIGARDSLAASQKLLEMWHSGTAWAAAGGPKEYLEGTVFKLSANVGSADTDV
jgi:Papain-like cysteine protease AvrRpt2